MWNQRRVHILQRLVHGFLLHVLACELHVVVDQDADHLFDLIGVSVGELTDEAVPQVPGHCSTQWLPHSHQTQAPRDGFDHALSSLLQQLFVRIQAHVLQHHVLRGGASDLRCALHDGGRDLVNRLRYADGNHAHGSLVLSQERNRLVHLHVLLNKWHQKFQPVPTFAVLLLLLHLLLLLEELLLLCLLNVLPTILHQLKHGGIHVP
mmetsp:Transcript_9760/g.21272  ORF Transcript_9760/g.21272 Transcript_9760/m.21272 type:complete len:207 (+) Transcript_9760:285-905(+)